MKYSKIEQNTASHSVSSRPAKPPYVNMPTARFDIPQNHPDWEVEVMGRNVMWYPSENFKIPNRFQRWMQEICFGIKWVRK